MLNSPAFRDLQAGLSAAVVTIAGWLTLGLLAYAPFGARAAELGIPAACTAVAIGGLVVALLGRSAMPSGGLSSATVLILAAATSQWAADPRLQSGGPVPVLALAACCVVLMGLLQLLMGVLRVGSLAKYVPQPVLAGFMNGVALLVLAAQLPLLLGVDASAWAADPLAALHRAQPATLLAGLATALAAGLTAWRFPRAPAGLIGLALGCLLYAALRTAWPAAALGPLTGAVPPPVLGLNAWPALLFGDAAALLRQHAPLVGITALLLAVIGSMESVLNALALDQDLKTRHDPNRELLAFGAANVVSGVLAGLPVVYWRARATALHKAGGTTRRAAASCAVATGVLYLVGGPLIALLPLTVLAGIMLTVAWGLVDTWTRRSIARVARGAGTADLWWNLALVGVVCGTTLWRGFVAGVGLGLLLAMGLFIHAMNRSLVRARFSGDQQPSRRVYPPAQEAALRDTRRRIIVLELEGALFFGNADRLAAQVEAFDAEVRFVVLDFKRISSIDASGAMVLAQLAARLAARGRQLLLAGVSPGNRHGLALQGFGAAVGQPAEDWFSDIDQAVETAEQCLLTEAGLALADAEVALDDCSLLQGLDTAQRERLLALLQPRRLAAQDILFRQGDEGDCLFVLTRGSITVSSPHPDSNGLHQRYVSFSPGMMLGETAMFDGLGRTADAVADVPSVVHALTRDALAHLGAEAPELARLLTTNIAIHLAERLRHAAAAWRVAAA